MNTLKAAILGGALFFGLMIAWPGSAQADVIERVSIATGGTQANDYSYYPSISADGRYVAFQSGADDLVPGDTNGGVADVFVHDRQTGTTERVSIATDGTQGRLEM
jgi:Tol biopolymer transport system component